MTIEFLTLPEGSIAFQRQVGEESLGGIFFLGGFASDMEGNKAAFLSRKALTENLSFVRFDYRGQGRSTGDFANATIGSKLEDALTVFDQLTKGPQVIVGSSMGGWLGLLLAERRPDRARAFIGVAAAPDFTEDLVWEKLSQEKKDTLLRNGQIFEGDALQDGESPIQLKLIEEARAHLVLRRPLKLSCPLRLLQGMKDRAVPWPHAIRIAEHIQQEDICVLLLKDGDHRLSSAANLDLLWNIISEFCRQP